MATIKKKWRNWNWCTVGGNVKWYSCYGKQCGGSFKKLKIELPYDPATTCLGIHPREVKAGHSSIIHKSQKMEATQVHCQRNVTYTYNGILLSLKKRENSYTCYNMAEP